MSKKIKTLKFRVLRKGETIDYQTVIEEIIGTEISRLSCYDPNFDCDPKYNDGHSYTQDSDRARAFFNPDCDYEIIIQPIKKQ